MTYRDAALWLGVRQVCFEQGCGLSANRHRTGVIDPFGVLHFSERRMTRAGLRRFLLLVVKRTRLADPYMLNYPKFTFWHLWSDNTEAGRLAANLGVRLPAALSRTDRLRCRAAARAHGIALSSVYPTIYAWARREL